MEVRRESPAPSCAAKVGRTRKCCGYIQGTRDAASHADAPEIDASCSRGLALSPAILSVDVLRGVQAVTTSSGKRRPPVARIVSAPPHGLRRIRGGFCIRRISLRDFKHEALRTPAPQTPPRPRGFRFQHHLGGLPRGERLSSAGPARQNLMALPIPRSARRHARSRVSSSSRILLALARMRGSSVDPDGFDRRSSFSRPAEGGWCNRHLDLAACSRARRAVTPWSRANRLRALDMVLALLPDDVAAAAKCTGARLAMARELTASPRESGGDDSELG